MLDTMGAVRCCDTRCIAPVVVSYVVTVGIARRGQIAACRWHEIALDRYLEQGGTLRVRPRAIGREAPV